MDPERLVLDAVYVLGAVVLANIFPSISSGPVGSVEGFIATLLLGSIGAIAYAYLEASYIGGHVVLSCHRSRPLEALLEAGGALLPYLAATTLVVVLSIISSLVAVNAPEQAALYAVVASTMAIAVDGLLLPYLLYTRMAGHRPLGPGDVLKTVGKGFLLLFLPWNLVVVASSLAVNTVLASLFGSTAVYPYFRGWSSEAVAALEEGTITTWMPSYGKLVGVLVVARYTAWLLACRARR